MSLYPEEILTGPFDFHLAIKLFFVAIGLKFKERLGISDNEIIRISTVSAEWKINYIKGMLL